MPTTPADPQLSSSPPSGGPFALIVIAGREPGRRYPLGRHTLILGRDPAADISLDDRRVSRHHARIEPEDDGGFLLVDNGSANGTMVNGELVRAHPLDVGDRISLATGVVLVFTRSSRLDEVAAQAQRLHAADQLAARVARALQDDLLAIDGAMRRPDAALLRALQPLRALTDQLARIGGLAGPPAGLDDDADVDLSAVLREAVAALGADSGVSVDAHIAPGLRCAGDAAALRSAFTALLDNAAQASARGGRIELEAHPIEVDDAPTSEAWVPEGAWLRVQIRDQGVGMTPDVCRVASEPLFTTREGAAGMGLSLAWATVRDHRGRLELRSRAQAGTTVIVHLPAG